MFSQTGAEDLAALRVRAEQGDARGQLALGDRYNLGNGVRRDYAEAMRWYRLAAAQGNSRGQFELGHMYANGRGVPTKRLPAGNP